MGTHAVTFHYTIQNGAFKGQQKSLTIPMTIAGMASWQIALHAMVTAGNATGAFISLYLYMRTVRGTGPAFREIGQRLAALTPPLPNLGQNLQQGENEMQLIAENGIAPEIEVVGDVEVAMVAEGALDAAAAATIVPGIGWAIGAGILALGTIVAGGLTIYEIANSGETPLASVVFINGIPNSKFQFTAANWTPGMHLVGGDTKTSMLQNIATSTMAEAGSLQYTWQTAGTTPSGTATIKFDFDSGSTTQANLTWSINPNTGTHHCSLVDVPGQPDLLSAACYKQPVQSGGKTHYVMLYVILPSAQGAKRASFTINPTKPLVYTNRYLKTAGAAVFGKYDPSNPDSVFYTLKELFTVGNKSYNLRDLTLPIFFKSGTNMAVISICPDNNGQPSATPIETFNTQLPLFEAGSPIVDLNSVTKPTLIANTKYWITVTMQDHNSNGVWAITEFMSSQSGSNTSCFSYSVGGDPIA